MTAVADFKRVHRAPWAAGDYAAIADHIDEAPSRDLVTYAPLAPAHSVAAGTARTLRLRLTRKQMTAVRQALTRGRRPSLTVRVVARDRAGNAAPRRLWIKAVR